MTEQQVDQLLERARENEDIGANQQARELYQQIIDEAPYSDAAKIAGERLMRLDDASSTTSNDGGESGGTESPEATGTAPEDGPNDWGGEETRTLADAEETPAAHPCPQCDGTDLVYGEVDNSQIRFAPGGAGIIDFDKQAVQARVCRDCGLLQPFVEEPGELE